MSVMEMTEKGANQIEEGVWSRKQYLETARGHYLSALAMLSGGKQDQTKVCLSNTSSFLMEDDAFNQASTSGQQGQAMTFAKMDVQIQMPNGVLRASQKDLQAVKLQLNKALARNTKSQITEMVCDLGSLGVEMDVNDASDRNFNRKPSSHSGDFTELLPNTMLESGSLHRMVESLKAELENLKKERADLKDIDGGAEFSTRNLEMRLHESNLENEGCIGRSGNTKNTYEEITGDVGEVSDLKSRTKGLKREHDTAKFCAKMEKRQKTVDVEERREDSMRTLNQAKSFPEGGYPTCVSTSESTARILVSEDELESSSQQVGRPAKLDKGAFTSQMGGVEGDKCDDTSEFSIRDFVFAARNKDISMNWPFSENNLQLCLKHGVKDVLPPFQPIDSLRDSTMKRSRKGKILQSEESNHDGRRSSMLRNNLGLGAIPDVDHSCNQDSGQDYRDSNSSPTERERNLEFKTITIANSQSEVESVSTSNIPPLEVSDEQEPVPINKAKNSSSQLSKKKCKVAVKMRVNTKRNIPEDNTSACTGPPDAISSKICPVCEKFSSSSNTTLNAHIDQCLSSQSMPTWAKSCKLSKPRIKPRRMKSMTDICATAPCCTLEDLDRRNGTNWATNTDLPSEDADMASQLNTPTVSSRYITNNVDDGSVYIDSSGTKIRILSKLNDTSPLPFSKTSEHLKLKKQSIKGKRSKFFSSNRKKRLAKHLKYLKVTHQRNRFSSLKVKVRSSQGSGTGEALHEVEDGHNKQHRSASFVKGLKAQGTYHPWISFKMSNILKENGSETITHYSGCEVQEAKGALIGNDQIGSLTKKHLNSPVRSVTDVRYNFRTSTHRAGVHSRSKIYHRGKISSGPSLRSSVRGNGEASNNVSLKLGKDAEVVEDITKESTPKSFNSTILSAPLLDVQPNTLQSGDNFLPARGKLPHGSHVGPCDGMKSHKSPTNISCDHVSQSICDQMDSSSCECHREKERETCAAQATQRSDENGDGDIVGPVPSSSLGIRVHEVEIENGAKKFQGPLYEEAEARGNLGQVSQSDEGEMCRNISEAENMSPREGDYVVNYDLGNFLAEVDPIPIPGPPGSDLPSFSDMGSEDLHRSSQSGSLDGYDDPSLSATSTISNLGKRENFSFKEQNSLSAGLVPYNVYAGGLGTNPQPSQGITTPGSPFTCVERERVASNSCVNQQCCCSYQEEIIWMNPRESQYLKQKQTSSESFSGIIHTNSTLNAESNVPANREMIGLSRRNEYDSGCPSAPILRLMGKDLMVSNSMETELSRSTTSIDAVVNGLVLPLGEISSRVKASPSEYPAFMGALLHGQDPHILDAGQFNVFASFVTPHNQSSGTMNVHSSFPPSLGTAPLQR